MSGNSDASIRMALLRHFLAALAYRTQKALRGAAETFGEFRAAPGVRTPRELVRHMTSVIGYAHTFYAGGSYTAEPLDTLNAEIERFHGMLEMLSTALSGGVEPTDVSAAQLLQGPLADAMTHVGQLAMLRRLAQDPVPPENFLRATIGADNVGSTQANPVAYGNRHGTWNPAGIADE